MSAWLRVGRFEVAADSARARAFACDTLYVPRSRREVLVLGLLRMLRRIPGMAGRLPLGLLAPPAERAAEAVPRDVAIGACSRAFAGSDLSCELALTPWQHAAAPRCLLFAWKGAEAEPFAVAKIARPEHSHQLEREARTLRELVERAPESAAAAPGVLASARVDGQAVLIEERRPGLPLARLHRLRPYAGDWRPDRFAAIGGWFGRLHESTASAGRCLVHGDAWSRNLLVDPEAPDREAPSGVVDWEASRRDGSPVEELLHFLLATAWADLGGRGAPAETIRSSLNELAIWTLGPGSSVRTAATAFLRAWWEAAPSLRPDEGLAEAAVARLSEGSPLARREGRLEETGRRALLAPDSALVLAAGEEALGLS